MDIDHDRTKAFPYLSVVCNGFLALFDNSPMTNELMYGDGMLFLQQAALVQIVLIFLLVSFLVFFVVFDSVPKLKVYVRLARQRRLAKRIERCGAYT